MRRFLWLSLYSLLSVISVSVVAEPWKDPFEKPLLWLRPSKQHLMPKLREAVRLISEQPECLSVDSGTSGIVGTDIDLPGRKGDVFRIGCEVSDLPDRTYDNFWVTPEELNRNAIYRELKEEFLTTSSDAATEPPKPEPTSLFDLHAVIDDPDGYTNVRSSKSTYSDIVTKIYEGEEFYTYVQKGNWWQVRTKDGILGYMHVSRIRILR